MLWMLSDKIVLWTLQQWIVWQLLHAWGQWSYLPPQKFDWARKFGPSATYLRKDTHLAGSFSQVFLGFFIFFTCLGLQKRGHLGLSCPASEVWSDCIVRRLIRHWHCWLWIFSLETLLDSLLSFLMALNFAHFSNLEIYFQILTLFSTS